MNILKKITVGAGLALACWLGPKAEAVEILTPDFLSGSNLVLLATGPSTATNGFSNIYMKAGVAITNTSAFTDVTLQKNPDGSWPDYSFAVSMLGTNAATTNNVTFTLRTVPDLGWRVTTEGQNTWSFALNCNGTTPVVLSTNVPKAFMQGCKLMRLTTVTTTAAAGAGNVVVERMQLGGGM